MAVAPPRFLAAMVTVLFPPASREHVLGDLTEQYESAARYVLDAVRILPFVVGSQIRRTWSGVSLVAHAFALWFCFATAASLTGVPSGLFYTGPGWWSRLIAMVSVLAGVVLLDAYTDPRSTYPPPQAALRYATLAVACVLLSQGFLGVWSVKLVLPGAQLAAASGLSALAFWLLRSMMPHPRYWREPEPASSLSPEALRGRMLDFQRRMRRRNLREYAAALWLTAIFSYRIWAGAEQTRTVALVLLLVGGTYVMYQLHTRGWPQSVPRETSFEATRRSYRQAVERQADLMSGIWSWYLLPMVPGFTVFVLSVYRESLQGAVTIAMCFVAVCLIAAELNRRQARKLYREIRTLPPADSR